MEATIIRLLEERGPLTGVELRETLGADGFGQWKACMHSGQIAVRKVGRRYLRLDQKVEGYARLSPSILREFLTYSVVGLASAQGDLAVRTRELASRIEAISESKVKLARRIVGEVGARLLDGEGPEEERFCVLLAGDIVYKMAHDAARPERSTGRMVKGSDLDLVIIVDDQAPEELRKRLDDAIYQEKYRHLNNPSSREEIDYVIKPLERMREQAKFDTFKHMVSCKILDEAILLYGSRTLYDAGKALLTERGIEQKLADMRGAAVEARARAETHLLGHNEDELAGEDLYLFHTSEESEEFE
jgi:hypothetical protein